MDTIAEVQLGEDPSDVGLDRGFGEELRRAVLEALSESDKLAIRT